MENLRQVKKCNLTGTAGLHGLIKKILGLRLASSLTIEAAVALPVFIVAMATLIYPLKVMDEEREKLIELEKTAEALSTVFNPETIAGEGNESIMLTNWITPGPGIIGTRVIVSSKRAWIGRKGGSGREYLGKDTNEGNEEDENDEIVYIANNSAQSSVFHVNIDCHYISNKNIRAVSYESATGQKYRACDSCHPGKGGTVYIFPGGDKFHAGSDCRALRSYVREMKKSEALERGLRPCSSCG
ncbi:MAG: hypothetical protein Q4B67_08620 [Eubacteriales bacterium]|nr:hypothetical protein [Eubacteriales bacterium]